MRKRITTWSLLLFGVVLLAGACEEVVVNKYEDAPFLYFFRGKYDIYGNGQNDSLSYSFYLKESARQRDTLWIDVRLSGLPSPVARPLPLAQVSAGVDDAVAGEHYVAFDDPEVSHLFVLPANATRARVPLIVLRDASLAEKEHAILLEVGTNDHFGAALDGQSRFLVRVSDLAAQPPNWTAVWRLAFGTWGPVKMRFIIDYVGFSDFDFTTITPDTRDYLKMKAKQKLAEYNASHPGEPLAEADGTKVTFPA
jgi:hypothetical protein